MKPVLPLLPLVLMLASCKKEETTAAPKAIEVKEEGTMAATEEAAAPRAIVVAEPGDASPAIPPKGNFLAKDRSTVGTAQQPIRKRLPQVVDRVGQALETAGEKTQEAAAVAEQRVPEALGVAREKTEVGLRKAADATGNFLQRAGEKIEEEAKEAQEP